LRRFRRRGTLLPSGCQIDIKLYTLLSWQCLLFLFAIHVRGGVASRVYLQLATIVAEMHFTLAHFGGCTSSQSQSQDTSHVASRSAFMAGFCFVFLCKLLFFKEVEGYKGFMLDGCAQVTLNGSHILRLSSCSLFPYLFPSLPCHKVAKVAA